MIYVNSFLIIEIAWAKSLSSKIEEQPILISKLILIQQLNSCWCAGQIIDRNENPQINIKLSSGSWNKKIIIIIYFSTNIR